jgi:hypothetical protein
MHPLGDYEVIFDLPPPRATLHVVAVRDIFANQ